MSRSRVAAIAYRIVRQLVRDRRTLVLIFFVPIVVMTLVGLSFPESASPGLLSFLAPALLSAMALFFAFILTGVSFLRERTQGTLERLMASPVSRGELVVGYLAGFALFAFVQSTIVLLFTIYALDVTYRGSLWQIFVFQIIITVGAVNMGIFVSTYARNEFQVVQFIPLVILPQIFLSGVLWPVEQMPRYLQWVSAFLPLTYAVQGLRKVMLEGRGLADVPLELGVLLAFAVAMSALGAATLRRG
ncbi:MAG: ABC transporter permease [Chloroflexi bacterium]|nr:ABC transporter permease [Chloroflexota bacterium]